MVKFFTPMRIDATKILTRRELATVLADLAVRAGRSANARLNRTILRLACCCGLRVSEIAGLRLGDVVAIGPRPHLRVRPDTAKGKRGRIVPLWWDAGTLADLTAWQTERFAADARARDPFVASQQAHRRGLPLRRHAVRHRFRTACKALGLARMRTLTIHHGRHTFISHALAGGRTLAEVRDAAGHANASVTSAYLHVVVDEDDAVGDLFRYDP
jgi:integrase